MRYVEVKEGPKHHLQIGYTHVMRVRESPLLVIQHRSQLVSMIVKLGGTACALG